jgi:peptidylprolyl isomerase
MRLKALVALFVGLLAAPVAAQIAQPVTAPPPLTPENTWVLDLSTGGRVAIQLRPDVAPNTVERIKTLTRRGFYNGLAFHRVIEGFMAQGGDPKGDGTGGSDLPNINAEFNALPHVRGTVAMARADDPNSANSQFFIMLMPKFSLDNNYTAFGRVVSGMNYVDAIEKGEPPANPSRILQASIGADNRPPPAPGAPTLPVAVPALPTTPQTAPTTPQPK